MNKPPDVRTVVPGQAVTYHSEPAPAPSGLNSKIGTLERRKEHLQRRIDSRSANYSTTPSADFDRAEISALNAAITCMRAQHALSHSFAILFYRGSGKDLATDIKAVVSAGEIVRLREAL